MTPGDRQICWNPQPPYLHPVGPFCPMGWPHLTWLSDAASVVCDRHLLLLLVDGRPWSWPTFPISSAYIAVRSFDECSSPEEQCLTASYRSRYIAETDQLINPMYALCKTVEVTAPEGAGFLEVIDLRHSLRNVDGERHLVGFGHRTEPAVPTFDGDRNDALTSCRAGSSDSPRLEIWANPRTSPHRGTRPTVIMLS